LSFISPRSASSEFSSTSAFTYTGSIDTIVVRTVFAAGMPLTKLPGVTSACPTRPATGARTLVNSRSSSADRSAASAASTPARDSASRAERLSASSAEIAWLPRSSAARLDSRSALSSCTFDCASAAWAAPTPASYQRGSIVKRTSPGRTSCPAWKWTAARWPLTRARTWTSSIASTRPVNSEYVARSRSSAAATVTAGRGGADACGAGRRLPRTKGRVAPAAISRTSVAGRSFMGGLEVVE
jgi:hypothetical protein